MTLNLHWFPTLDRARLVIEAWRRDCNQVRPHSALGERTPAEFLAAFTGEHTTALQPEGIHHKWINFGGHLKDRPRSHPTL